jgi:hypothetical protein
MALPKINQLIQSHTVTLAEDLVVTFQLVPIPGSQYSAILEAHRDPEGKSPHEAVAVDVLTAGITAVYSSVESSPVAFTSEDAAELWEQWPDWARWDVYTAVTAYTTRGPAADPFSKSRQNENEGQ